MSDAGARAAVETVYTPSTRARGFAWGGFSPRAYWDLTRGLIEAQIKVRFRRSVLGLAWFALNPLLFMALYAFVFGAIFTTERANYRLFLLAGLFPWQAMTAGVAASLKSLLMGTDLLKKAQFPSAILPLTTAGASMINLLMVLVVYAVYMTLRGFPVLTHVHWLLVAFLLQTLLLVGLSFLLGSLNVFFRDLEQIVGFMIWIWFFLTPIIFPLNRVYGDNGRWIEFLNPMAPIVQTYQKAFLGTGAPPYKPLLASLAVSLTMIVLGWRLLRRWQFEFAKET
ncbi:MAG TPA: ABC transporter permease [Actinomycetota bacterium]|nr:ABC transporter permease [Actinomycetota bacterium]